jgi:hypothetical protein
MAGAPEINAWLLAKNRDLSEQGVWTFSAKSPPDGNS